MKHVIRSMSPLFLFALLIIIAAGLGVIARKTQQEKTEALFAIGKKNRVSEEKKTVKAPQSKPTTPTTFQGLREILSTVIPAILAEQKKKEAASSSAPAPKQEAAPEPEDDELEQSTIVPGTLSLPPGYLQ